MVNTAKLVLGFSSDHNPGKTFAEALDYNHDVVQIHRFPDGESRIVLPQQLPSSLIFFRTLNQPNLKLVELYLAAQAAREHGVKHLTLVAPYLCYMRQDHCFNPGEAVSQLHIGHWLSQLFDRVITVDPHLHRVNHIDQVLTNGHNVSAAPEIARFLKSKTQDAILLGPDEESRQWLEAVAEQSGFDFFIATKQRYGDKDVEVALPTCEVQDRHVVIIDDIASTGHTLATAAKNITQQGCATIDCFVTHALISQENLDELHNSGVRHLWSTDSVHHSTNVVSLASLLADAVYSPIEKCKQESYIV